MRRASRLKNPDPSRVTIVEGDVVDLETLKGAMYGQDVVYANLAGSMEQQAKTIVNAMQAMGLKRLIFISLYGLIVKLALTPCLEGRHTLGVSRPR